MIEAHRPNDAVCTALVSCIPVMSRTTGPTKVEDTIARVMRMRTAVTAVRCAPGPGRVQEVEVDVGGQELLEVSDAQRRDEGERAPDQGGDRNDAAQCHCQPERHGEEHSHPQRL